MNSQPRRDATLDEFARYHLPALSHDEVRYNILIATLLAAVKTSERDIARWTLGGPGACAIQTSGRSILLGDLDREQCHGLADLVDSSDYPGVVGLDQRPAWFVERATASGTVFDRTMSMRLHTLAEPPKYPMAEGSTRAATPADAHLIFEWLTAFRDEVLPHEPPVTVASAERASVSGRYHFWTIDGEPTAMAAIGRRLQTVASVGSVFTPPELRRRGYAGAVTAAVSEHIFAEGRATACLFTDLANPSSNRCYARIGFKPYCDAAHIQRRI